MRKSLIPPHIEQLIRKPIKNTTTEQVLIEQAQGGKKAAETLLVNSNIAFVAQIASGFVNQTQLPFLVLLGEGAEGLRYSIYTWKPKKGVTRLISWGVYWIRAAILKAIHADHIVPYPSNFWESKRSIEKECLRQMKKTGRSADVNRVMEDLNIPMLDRMRFVAYGRNVVSFDEPACAIMSGRANAQEGGTEAYGGSHMPLTLADVLADKRAPNPEYVAHVKELRERIRFVLAQDKDSRLPDVLFAVEGLAGTPKLNPGELGKEMGLTAERIRQLNKKAKVLLASDEMLKNMTCWN